jgi:uncharacterized protein (DUF2236 family)
MFPIIRLPKSLQLKLYAAASSALVAQKGQEIDFAKPLGEAALLSPDSISWRIFKNPVALFVGGIAAVILELADPAVRSGVWNHSTFRTDPLGRLRRTGLAAMVTIYGARSVAEPMIAAVVRMHAKVIGETPAGVPFCANDSSLLKWVHATASFSFAQAYSRYVAPLSRAEMSAWYLEGVPVSRLYGALDAPSTELELQELFDAARERLEPSAIIFEFLQIMRDAPVVPMQLRWMQRLMVGAAVEIIPAWMRERLGLSAAYGVRRPWDMWVVKLAGALADRIVVADSPASQSCLRLGLPPTFLYGIPR